MTERAWALWAWGMVADELVTVHEAAELLRCELVSRRATEMHGGRR